MEPETNLVQIISCPNAESKENSFEEDCGDKEDIIVKHTKISDVPKENQIRLDDQTLFQFSTYIENDKLVLKLDEIGAFSPFIFLKKLTLEDFIKIHKMFKSCDDLEEVKKHIGNLFADGRIKLDQKKDAEDTIILKIKARHISGEVEIEIKGQRRMTTQKDESLMKLYKIQKDEIKIMKEIEKFIKDHEEDDNEIINKIKELSLKNEI